MRLAPAAFTRCVGLALLTAALGGCSAGGNRIAADWMIAPATPVIGTVTSVRITLRDADRNPIDGAHLQLEAHMSHPGMRPVVASAIERVEGVYEAQLRFTMTGDWVLVLTGTMRDGTRVTETRTIPGVRPTG